MTPPYLVLHREEFAWPHLLPDAPVRSYIKPVGPHHFTHHLRNRSSRSRLARWLVFFLLHLSSFELSLKRPAVSGLAALWCSDFPLPDCSGSDRPICSLCKAADYSKRCSTGTTKLKPHYGWVGELALHHGGITAGSGHPKYLKPTRRLYTRSWLSVSARATEAIVCEIARAKRFGAR